MLSSGTRSPWGDLEALSWASCTGMSISAVDAEENTANQRHRQKDKRNTNAARFKQNGIRFTLPEGSSLYRRQRDLLRGAALAVPEWGPGWEPLRVHATRFTCKK